MDRSAARTVPFPIGEAVLFTLLTPVAFVIRANVVRWLFAAGADHLAWALPFYAPGLMALEGLMLAGVAAVRCSKRGRSRLRGAVLGVAAGALLSLVATAAGLCWLARSESFEEGSWGR